MKIEFGKKDKETKDHIEKVRVENENEYNIFNEHVKEMKLHFEQRDEELNEKEIMMTDDLKMEAEKLKDIE